MTIPLRVLILVGGLAAESGPSGTPPWRPTQDALRAQTAGLAANLEVARSRLLARARGSAESLALLAREPVRLRLPGYGVLPEIVDNEPAASVTPTERSYSLARLAEESAAAFQSGARLAERSADPRVELRPLVADLEALEKRLRSIEDHLGYHAYWQQAVADYPEFFRERNEIVGRVRAHGAGRHVLERLAPFRPTPGLAIAIDRDGTRSLAVTVTTDIEESRFLEAFREGVEAAFVRAEAARAARFRVDLRFALIPPAELYPEGPPAQGAPIDPRAHLARFPPEALVLTTGEESTNAWTGASIVLGPAEMSRRTLAHEFAHLLGFRDAYLRGFDAAGDERFGVVLVEWTGLTDDLMGNAKGGRVSPEMIRTLIEAYGSD